MRLDWNSNRIQTLDSRKFYISDVKDPIVEVYYENNNPYLLLKLKADIAYQSACNYYDHEANIEILKIDLSEIDINFGSQLSFGKDESHCIYEDDEYHFERRNNSTITFKLWDKETNHNYSSALIIDPIPQKMTLEDIERKLGHKIEIVDNE